VLGTFIGEHPETLSMPRVEIARIGEKRLASAGLCRRPVMEDATLGSLASVYLPSA